jgi:DNA-directed RNA polymerase subunit M/transcription elongation factor TFIIS
MTIADTDISIEALEKLMEDDLVCTSELDHPCNTQASYVVTRECGESTIYWCVNRKRLQDLMMASTPIRCAYCGQAPMADTHWTVIPI